MKLIFLGAGSAFTVGGDNYQSNMLLENDAGKRLLIDCGTDIRFSLHDMGLDYSDITDVYISHLHADHAGGLEWLGFNTKFNEGCGKPNLYISESLVEPLWENVLSGGMSSLQGEMADIHDYFNVLPIKSNAQFTWGGCEFQLVQTVHIMHGFTLVPSFGLLFTANEKRVLITTDTQLTQYLSHRIFCLADIIFQDCETAERPSRVHARYEELVMLGNDLKSKMWLYHYNPGALPDAKKDGFCGFVKRGQIFDFNDPGTFK